MNRAKEKDYPTAYEGSMQRRRRGGAYIIARALGPYPDLICGSPNINIRSPLPLLGVPEIGLVIKKLLRRKLG